MRKIASVLALSFWFAFAAAAHGGGMGGGGQMGSGGAGMLTVADDGSLLVTEMSSMMGGGPGGGMGGDDRALVNIDADGNERWRATFDDGWPMMAVTDGNLVVFTLREDWWSGTGGNGDGGWNHGGGHGGGGGGGGGGGPHADSAIVVGLDLVTGNELWRTVVEGDMISTPQFTHDGTQFYLTVRDFGEIGSGLGGGSMHQGDAPGAHELMSTSVVAIGRDGVVLWSVDLADGPVVVTSRTWTSSEPAGSYGQTITGIPITNAAYPDGGQAGALRMFVDQKEGFRTNLGLTNISGVAATVEVEIFTANGAPAPGNSFLTLNLAPYSMTQINDLLARLPQGDREGLIIRAGLSSGEGAVLAYASTVDNTTNDASYQQGFRFGY